jgi:hypothetical protein
MKRFNEKLNHLVSKLPVHEPSNELWDKINKQLEFNERLKARSQNLPEFEPKDLSWKIIEKSLNRKNHTVKSKAIIALLSTAASIALIIGFYSAFFVHKHENISVSEEISNNWQEPIKASSSETTKNALGFINKQCEINSYICNQPSFTEKKQQLDDVEIQIKNIEQVINTSGNSSSLIKTRIKLENLKAKIMKELINMITS